MHRTLVLPLLMLLASIPAWSADAPATKSPAQATPEQAVAEFRNDLQAKRADVMAKNLSLTAEQAAKFWPLFDQFQKEQNVIIDAQSKALQKLASHFETLTDAEALEYVDSLLTRDDQMHALRLRWLAKFQSVVPPKVAARAIQIDRRLSNATQVAISAQVPLVR
jgi:Spy/CpxP family protein refolding chaperone